MNITGAILVLLPAQTYIDLLKICIMPWSSLPVNNDIVTVQLC